MNDVNQRRLERLQNDLESHGMTETEAYYRAKVFLQNVDP